MIRYLWLAIFCILGFAALTYLYFHSQSSLTAHRLDILRRLAIAKQSDTELDKEILRIQNFSLLNYDSLVASAAKLESFCADENRAKYSEVGPKFNLVLGEFCTSQKREGEMIDLFKSKNAIYRNSLLYLHEKSIEWRGVDGGDRSRKLALEIINRTLVYELFTNEDARLSLKTLQKKAKAMGRRADLDIVADHAQRILETRPILEKVILDITDPSNDNVIDRLHAIFDEKCLEEETRASVYRETLFALSLVLLVSVIYNLLGLWKAATQLREINTNLEERVEERTRALQESQLVVTEQQQALAVSSKFSALGEMAGGLAHEINTPLAVIQMRTDQLLEGLSDNSLQPETLTKSLHAIDHTVKRISQIVRGLRSFARDGSKDPKEIASARAIVEETFTLCRERFANHGVDLTLVAGEDFALECRPSEISQVLLNLLNNAYDAIQAQPEKWIRVEFSRFEAGVRLDVVDCGHGIPAAVREKMLIPFFTTKEVGKGTGLGLSISKGIIEGHGGRLFVDPESVNTRFSVLLPSNILKASA